MNSGKYYLGVTFEDGSITYFEALPMGSSKGNGKAIHLEGNDKKSYCRALNFRHQLSESIYLVEYRQLLKQR